MLCFIIAGESDMLTKINWLIAGISFTCASFAGAVVSMFENNETAVSIFFAGTTIGCAFVAGLLISLIWSALPFKITHKGD